VLVFHDLLGLWSGRVARFVRQYADLEPRMVDAVARWRDDVRAHRFPAAAESYGIAEEELRQFKALVARDAG
jgi:3-methyl-2-oxobutanoate hydroxymethyltransferase